MKITLGQLRRLIREAVELYEAKPPARPKTWAELHGRVRPKSHTELIGKHVKLTDEDGLEQMGVVTAPQDADDVTHLTLRPSQGSGKVTYFVPEETDVVELSPEELAQHKAQGAANTKSAGDLYSQDQQKLPKPAFKKPVQNSD